MYRVKATMKVKRYSPRTVKTYCYWIRYFIHFNGVRHPASMGGPEVRAFLEHHAVQRHVAAATQNQALNAIVFLYHHVLAQPLGDIGDFAHARQSRRLPVVLSHEQVTCVLNQLSGSMHLMASLMYGSGLRGVTGPQEPGNHADLYTCAGQRFCRRSKPARLSIYQRINSTLPPCWQNG
ncbi:phage integrase N-terminal SAM-like domain-containing protein [Halomonas sp. M5N1S17]|uniref:phage integrase N-terminal SAM-like domain-containing protein n=1 Tax=Halomonas alkalisoli TaxID=2907158 RepID=UPI001F324CFA|nr:phage integrase N-terminal SAM-like domain-containing protein [Halomonas alkalisoli]MCE9663905.1 phage integrase N-terminal SAM-like domain-containing protein [Halomonas alkalisoli]